MNRIYKQFIYSSQMIKALSHIRRLPFVKYKQLKMKQKRSSIAALLIINTSLSGFHFKNIRTMAL